MKLTEQKIIDYFKC